MHLSRHFRVVRHIGVLIARIRVRTIHSSYLHGNAMGFQGPEQFPGQRFCFTCGDPDHLMLQCTSQRGHGGPRPNFSFQTRPPAPQGRDRGRLQLVRVYRVSSSGDATQQSWGRGTTQARGRRGGHYYAFHGDLNRTPLMLLSQYHPSISSTCVYTV